MSLRWGKMTAESDGGGGGGKERKRGPDSREVATDREALRGGGEEAREPGEMERGWNEGGRGVCGGVGGGVGAQILAH